MKMSRRNLARLAAQTAKGPAESKYGAKQRAWRAGDKAEAQGSNLDAAQTLAAHFNREPGQ